MKIEAKDLQVGDRFKDGYIGIVEVVIITGQTDKAISFECKLISTTNGYAFFTNRPQRKRNSTKLDIIRQQPVATKAKPFATFNGESYRLRQPGEKLPIFKGSFEQHIKDYDGGKFTIGGFIGKTGTKSHKFTCHFIKLNGENIVIHIHSKCGAQKYKFTDTVFTNIHGSPSCRECRS